MLVVHTPNALEILDNHSKKLVGEILTIIEASIPDNSTRDAVKTTIKRAIWRVNNAMKENVNAFSFQSSEEQKPV